MRLFLLILLITSLSSCKSSKKSASLCLKKKEFSHLPGWQEDDLRPAFVAFKNSCKAFEKQERGTSMGLSMSMGLWHDICERADNVSPKNEAEVRAFFEENFTPYQCEDHTGDKTGLYTGYYESELRGSLKPSKKYRYPLYKRPPDLVKKGKQYGKKSLFSFGPHHDRKAINKGALKGKDLELLWVDSDVDSFFLHVQGSGRVRLDDGRHIRVGYDGANGHGYTSIGKILIEAGHVEKEKMSMQAIRKWIQENPYKGKELMEKNASYVFFRHLEDQGAIGAQGIPVSTGRSLAVDKRFVPYGVPMWMDITHPENKVNLQRLVIAQDTGGAIKGPLRGDVFWGFGKLSEKIAGQMKAKGQSYLLLPSRVSFSGCHRA